MQFKISMLVITVLIEVVWCLHMYFLGPVKVAYLIITLKSHLCVEIM